MTKVGTLTHVGRGVFLWVSHAPTPSGRPLNFWDRLRFDVDRPEFGMVTHAGGVCLNMVMHDSSPKGAGHQSRGNPFILENRNPGSAALKPGFRVCVFSPHTGAKYVSIKNAVWCVFLHLYFDVMLFCGVLSFFTCT